MPRQLKTGESAWIRRAFWILILATLALRLGVLAQTALEHPQNLVVNDSGSYMHSALALLQHGSFSFGPERLQEPQTVRTPGYPLFIAGIYALFGQSPVALVAAQIILGGFSLGLCFHLARRLWGDGAALLALAIFALDPVSFLLSQLVLSESLFTLLFLLLANAGVSLSSGQGRLLPICLGLSLALVAATFVRPISYYLILPLALFVAVRVFLLKNDARLAAVCLMALVLPWLFMIGGWQMRNYAVSGSATFSHIQGINLLRYRAADVVSRRDGMSRDQAYLTLLEKVDQRTTPADKPGQVYDLYSEEALKVLKNNPWLTLRGAIDGLVKILFVPIIPDIHLYLGLGGIARGPVGDLARLSPGQYAAKWLKGRPLIFCLHLLVITYLLFIYAGVALGALYAWRNRGGVRVAVPLLLFLAAYLLFLPAGAEANPRFRGPAMPLLAVLAAGGWVSFFQRRRS